MEFLTDLLANEALQTALLGFFGILLAAIINRVAGAFTVATGIQIEKTHREALHEAIMSGAASAVEHGPCEALGTLRAHAITHARRSVPDAIKALVPGDGVLDAIADRYVREALAMLDQRLLPEAEGPAR